ncbi:hypothetical protein O7632_14105 [Solwaraspora sp. WMMD406]|uniref:hypothetical protein n=1 Tax=Solwaraspora sp. WMMD406 TaxID=3016095 RepID=UPI002417E3D0|nr:hypothetical protein [Solwaraspora sp. WMMD406]MDG4765219.1 hypothetical protein [Solwaraspora sp. WMMD406]
MEYDGLWPRGATDTPIADYGAVRVCPGDVVDLRAADHLDGLRPVRLEVGEVGPDVSWQSWINLLGKEISDDPNRNGKLVMVRPYKDALRRPGTLTQRDPVEECARHCGRAAGLAVRSPAGDAALCPACALRELTGFAGSEARNDPRG